jgi:hypothetical protein
MNSVELDQALRALKDLKCAFSGHSSIPTREALKKAFDIVAQACAEVSPPADAKSSLKSPAPDEVTHINNELAEALHDYAKQAECILQAKDEYVALQKVLAAATPTLRNRL